SLLYRFGHVDLGALAGISVGHNGGGATDRGRFDIIDCDSEGGSVGVARSVGRQTAYSGDSFYEGGSASRSAEDRRAWTVICGRGCVEHVALAALAGIGVGHDGGRASNGGGFGVVDGNGGR